MYNKANGCQMTNLFGHHGGAHLKNSIIHSGGYVNNYGDSQTETVVLYLRDTIKP